MITAPFDKTPPQISVVLCTHNPRAAYLSRTLMGLRAQTLPCDQWEFVLVDNASDQPLSATFDLSWHPRSKHTFEQRLGLTQARLKGLAETSSSLLLYVDDDNVLDADYLETAIEIGRNWPILGAWGGQCIAEYEIQPPSHLSPYLQGLAVRSCKRDSWSNIAVWSDAFPFGAGLCVRREVMVQYQTVVTASPLRLSLDRTGRELLSAGDYDIGLTSCDMGMGCGVFQALKLTHIIPAQRVSDEYMLRLEYGHRYSNTLLACLRGEEPPDPLASWRARIKWKLGALRLSTPRLRFHAAAIAGIRDALRIWHDHAKLTPWIRRSS
jgi:glycosyltransferase involved in cell wall biosynthesis